MRARGTGSSGEGLEHIVEVQRQGKGVLLLSGHFCSLDFAGRILMHHHRVCFTFQELRNRVFDRAVREARARRCHILIHRHDTRSGLGDSQRGSDKSVRRNQDLISRVEDRVENVIQAMLGPA